MCRQGVLYMQGFASVFGSELNLKVRAHNISSASSIFLSDSYQGTNVQVASANTAGSDAFAGNGLLQAIFCSSNSTQQTPLLELDPHNLQQLNILSSLVILVLLVLNVGMLKLSLHCMATSLHDARMHNLESKHL